MGMQVSLPTVPNIATGCRFAAEIGMVSPWVDLLYVTLRLRILRLEARSASIPLTSWPHCGIFSYDEDNLL